MSRAISILLVEDDPAHVALVRRSLSSFETALNLAAVSSLYEARRYLRHLVPDIAIVDLTLPDGQGVELLDEYTGFPILVLTSHADQKAAVLSLRAGAADYVVKDEAAFRNLPHIVLSAYQGWCARHVTQKSCGVPVVLRGLPRRVRSPREWASPAKFL